MEKRFKDYETKSSENKIEGFVLKYNEPTDIGGGMLEMFDRGSIEIADDASMLFNHNENNLLGRMGANLEFEDRPEGMYYRLELPQTSLADDIKELVKKDVIRGASLGFIPEKERMQNGVRVIEKARLDELSLVTKPAYDSSSAMVRSFKPKKRRWNHLIIGV